MGTHDAADADIAALDRVAYTAAAGVVEGDWVEKPIVEVDRDGAVLAVRSGNIEPGGDSPPIVHDLGRALLLPGMVNAHSHGFQRRLRGAIQTRSVDGPSAFWTWRDVMYAAAALLDPEQIYAASRIAYAEMLAAGITCVGEFHYLHHQDDGRPYDDPNELSRAIIRAAADVGIRLVLLEAFYARSGPGRAPTDHQRRFCDGSVDAYLRRVEQLRSEGVSVGIAPHSVRAVSFDELRTLAAYAHAHHLPLHAHVSEQPGENEACRDEYGLTPTQVLAEAGALARARGFTAVHAIHLEEADRQLLSEQIVCACPSTAADLGDGILAASELYAKGTQLSLGSDTNAVIDLVQEARLLEANERLRTRSRLRLCDAAGRVWPVLLDAATSGGASALGGSKRWGALAVGRPFDACVVDLDHSTLSGLEPHAVMDALLLSGTAAPVERVFVGGERVL
jgi:formimidoylglutamate deiminase